MKNRIKELRHKKHLTQKELGHKVKLSVGAISGYETGARNPDYETWDKLAKALKVTASYLQGFDADGKEEYAMYRGDQFIDLGTVTYLAEKYHKKKKSLKFLATPSAHKRGKNKRLLLYRIEGDLRTKYESHDL